MTRIQSSSPMMPMMPMQRSLSQPMIQNGAAAPIGKPQMNAETRSLMARAGGSKGSVGCQPSFCMGNSGIEQAVMQAHSGNMHARNSAAKSSLMGELGSMAGSVLGAVLSAL